jgi:hypothetical protein
LAFGEKTFKRALREELRFPPQPSFFPELVRKIPGTDIVDSYGLNHVYVARLSFYDGAGNYLYTGTDIDLAKYWTDRLTQPENTFSIGIYSRVGVRYGYVCAYAKLPDYTGYDEGPGFFVGFELGGGAYWGIISWYYLRYLGANHLRAAVGGSGWVDWAAFYQISNLPADYLTAKHYYCVKVNRGQAWFSIDGRIRGVVLFTGGAGVRRVLYDNSKPYTIYIAPFYVPEVQPVLIELAASKGGKPAPISVEMGRGDVRWCEGDPQPPLSMPLYLVASDTLLAGYSVGSGSVTSHPIPTFGYSSKTLYFMANQPGTLEIQSFLLSGNWRTYDTVSVPANTLLSYRVDDEVLLARAIFTPSAYPATILEAEVDMS